MNLAALEIFADVMRRGSLSAVARERDIAPSSISRTITALERELGARLFHRTTRRLAPTDAAAAFFAQVEPHLDGLRDARDAVTDKSDSVRGVLRVSASVSFGVERLAPIVSEFAKIHPDVTIELVLTDAVVDLVAERFDLAIRHGPLSDSSLVAQKLVATRYFVAASRAYLRRAGRPASPSDLAEHRCLTFPFPGVASYWRFRDARRRVEEVAITGHLSVNSGLVLRQCALADAGVVLLSDWLIGDDLAAGRLLDLFPRHEVTPTNFHTVISVVHPSRKLVPRKVRAFVDLLKDHLSP
jgi:DNA-binding transcriptional LysR family regulator